MSETIYSEKKIIEELNRAKAELTILYEISNAMRTTLNLDKILYIILTGITAHIGLGFNRAMLFLVSEDKTKLEGKMGIGPDNIEAANSIWKYIETEKKTLEDLVESFSNEIMDNSKFNKLVKTISISTNEKEGGILAICLNSAMPLHITKEKLANLTNDPLLKFFVSNEFLVVPLQAKDEVIGLVVVDNFVTQRPINKEDIRILSMFANQAGLAIENSRLYEKTLLGARTDLLTGCWNHGYFQQCLDEILNRSREKSIYTSLLFLDIDNFKIFNDTWGHQRGDEVLIAIAKLIKDLSRKQDLVARYGGEEFAIILPGTSTKEAQAIAERIRSEIEKYHFEPQSGEHPQQRLTISIGIATFPEHGTSKAELIGNADNALYQAKKSGKNRIILASKS